MPKHHWIISQIGSRQHYGVPRGFETTCQLKRFYTDAWCPRFAGRLLRYGNAPLRAFAARWHGEVPSKKVVSFNVQAIRDGITLARAKKQTQEETYREYLRIGRIFDQSVADHLTPDGRVDPSADAFFGFNTGALQTLRLLRTRGVRTVLDQIDPAKVEEDMVFAEAEKWPGWQSISGRVPQEYWDHMAAEWEAADLVLVNSEWSRKALVAQGVPNNKICIVPVAYEPDVGPIPLPRRDTGPLTVLWLGSVILRKGIPYLIEAAKLLTGTKLKFIVAGPIGISQQALSSAPANMTFMGRVTRDQTDQVYQSADIFVLPTISDGFAVTQVEAMSKGLPVITTPNCGQVVTDGLDGLVVPAGNSAALAEAIAKLDNDRPLLAEMSHNAFLRSTQFLLPNQARQVEAAVTALAENRPMPVVT
jgi:glycosyltransferase involved in cell wall biosynthesis